MTVRPVVLLAAAVLTLAPVAACGTSGAVAASCVGPQPAVAPAAPAPGQQVTYTVEWLHSGCRDTVPSDEVEKPLLDVPVEVVQGSGHAVVGTVSGTGEHFSGSITFVVPVWLRPGAAELVLHTDVPARLPVTVVAG